MKLKKVKIENFKIIEKLELDFTDSLGRVRDFTVLTGPNGCGKTTILDAIIQLFDCFDEAYCFCNSGLRSNEKNIVKVHRENKFLNNITVDSRIKLDLARGNREYQLLLEEKEFSLWVSEETSDVGGGRMVYFAQERQFSSIKALNFSRYRQFIQRFYTPLFSRLIQLDYPLDDKQLSGGQKECLYFITLFARYQINHSLVLIDELELHLHPSLQLELLKILPQMGTDNQFIITTYSPYIAEFFPPDAVITLG